MNALESLARYGWWGLSQRLKDLTDDEMRALEAAIKQELRLVRRQQIFAARWLKQNPGAARPLGPLFKGFFNGGAR